MALKREHCRIAFFVGLLRKFAMKDNDSSPDDAAILRRRAEDIALKNAPRPPDIIDAMSPEEARLAMHELLVHQIELEMQNDELRRTQVELEAARARYFDLYDLAPLGYCTISVKGMILEANLTAATLIGVARSALVKQPISRFIHKDDQDIYYLHRKHLLETGAPQVCELRMLKDDGSIFWAHLAATAALAEGEKTLCRVIMRDITTRKQAEELLRENEQNYRTLANSGQALVWTAGTDKLCNYFNTVWLDFTGRTIDQEMGNGWAEGVHPDDLQKCLDIYTGSFDRREKFSMEYRLRRRDGEFRWLLDDGCPRYDSRGEFIGYIGHCLDISEHKRAGEEKAKLESQFQQAQKMESVGRLAGGVAHDFNNMLGVILGHTEMAMEQADPSQPLFADLVEIRKAAERSADLTRQLLAFARKQTVAPKVLDLNETVEGTLKMLRRLIGENIDLAWLPQAGLWQVKIDPSQIDQVLANLCVNARDAINGIGRVTIETGKIHFDEAYCTQNAGFLSGEFVMLTVSDNGGGMDKETQLHIFEPFFTTKDVGQGTGLGLATVYGIIRQNEGFINVYSEPGQGTIFRIYLPRYKGKALQMQKEVPSIPAQRGNETILLVEDEPGILKITSMMLKKQGYSVIEAGTPGEAIRLAREHAGEIHLVLTDVVMPEMNGRDLARNLMSLYPDIRCMFMSGYTADIIANQGIIEEGVNFIQKPFTLKDLSTAVRAALGRN